MAGGNPFKAQLRAAGAVFTERWGVELAEHFGDSMGEYAAVRHAVGLVDFSFRGLLEVTGGDRVRWLNGQITNDAKRLGPGGGMLAAVLTAKGHLLADLAVYGLPDAFWVDLNGDRLEPVAATFDRYIIADDVAVSDLSGRIAHLALAGPAARDLVAGVAGEQPAGLSPWQHREAQIGGVPVRVMATRWFALPGYDVLVPAAQAGDVWAVLVRSGDCLGLRPVGLAALERLRVEAGWPWYGRDFDDSTLLMEALTEEHVSFTKGCYIGQEVVIRIQHQGHVNKRLCGLIMEGGSIPPAGSTLHLGERKVGTVTSAAVSPALGRVIALGYVRHEGWEPGTKLRLVSGDTSAEAEVTQLPFIGARG